MGQVRETLTQNFNLNPLLKKMQTVGTMILPQLIVDFAQGEATPQILVLASSLQTRGD